MKRNGRLFMEVLRYARKKHCGMKHNPTGVQPHTSEDSARKRVIVKQRIKSNAGK